MAARAAKRLEKELKEMTTHPPTGISVCLIGDNLFVWKGFIDGPEGSPYEGGRWEILIKIGPKYPFEAPKVTFVTPILHCNVTSNGFICVDILKDKWSVLVGIKGIMMPLHQLITEPNPDDPVFSSERLAALFICDRATHDRNVRQHTLRYATKKKSTGTSESTT